MGTRLYSVTSVEEQWRSVAGPWLRERAAKAWRDARPTVLLTPGRAESFYLRGRMVAEGTPYLGVRFWTPSDARKFLLAESGLKTGAATLAEQRLLARTCAEKLGASGDDPTLASVVREPGAFLRAYDLLLGAGWNPARDGAVYGRKLAREFQRALKERGIATQAGLHLLLRRAAAALEKPIVANLLVVGFNAAHWPLWELLKATVLAAEDAVVALNMPGYFARDVDALWCGSWEEWAKSIAAEPDNAAEIGATPFTKLAESYEVGSLNQVGEAEIAFCVTPDLASQTRAVVLRGLDYLRRRDCARLGIVFPEANALALEVAAELRRLGIPLDDGTGAWMPGMFETRCWTAWLALQEEPGVERLVAWVRACEAQKVSCGVDVSAREIAKIVQGALNETLADDLDVLADHLESVSTKAVAKKIAGFLRRRIALPATGAFSEFLALLREAMALPGWEEYRARLRIDPPKWLRDEQAKISRRTFLEWLKETTASQVRTRGAEGNHFYGKVHLLIYAQMSGQTWSHLILTGLNEGVWPRVVEPGAFGSRHELAALNKQARGLNLRGTMQGAQGEGQETVAPDKGHCLLPLERQDISLRDLCAALESTSHAVSLCAITTEAGRSLLPSDFFNHAYQSVTGRSLDEEIFRSMANATETWCKEHEALFESKEEKTAVEIVATKRAYAARRDETHPFGPYEFAYAQPPAKPIQLLCKQWDWAWHHPAAAWLQLVVGAEAWPDGALSWPQTAGSWVHRWLAAALRDCRERGSTAEMTTWLERAADGEATRVRHRARAAGIELYPWWDQVWSQAKGVAIGLAETLAPQLQDQRFFQEFILPEGLVVALPGSDRSDFMLKGRIDLLLVDTGKIPDAERFDFRGCSCWVIDFKTGSAPVLSEKKIGEGEGLQTVLYALAVRAMGAATTAISLHTPDANLKQQVVLENVLETTPVFRSLEKLHRDGVFGMRPDAENAYGFAPDYPLATRFVPASVLEAKWTRTHGTAPLEERA